jgi:hypothetical protein
LYYKRRRDDIGFLGGTPALSPSGHHKSVRSNLTLAICGIVFVACRSTPETFQRGTEFGLRLNDTLNSNVRDPYTVSLSVDYPDEFRGDEVTARVSSDLSDVAVFPSNLSHRANKICLSGTVIGVRNSKGLRDQDEHGVQLSAVTVQVTPATTTIMTSETCTGQGETLTCTPMAYPVTVPGTESVVLRAARTPFRLKPGSSLIVKMSDVPCPSK